MKPAMIRHAVARSMARTRVVTELASCIGRIATTKRGSPAAPLGLHLVRCNEIIAVRYGDWRRPIAALLGRFLPKLRAAP